MKNPGVSSRLPFPLFLLVLGSALGLAACGGSTTAEQPGAGGASAASNAGAAEAASHAEKNPRGGALEKATFAGGCFWCMETAFEGVDGIVSATSGYAGGATENPTYEEVSAGGTGHAESVQVVYDPAKISYPKLLDIFWHNVDPTQGDGQFCDIGSQYRSAIFYQDDAQRRLAEESQKRIEATKPFPGPIVTQIVPLKAFYPAEAYHQDYYKKNPIAYKTYRLGCGRDRRLHELWGAAPAHP